MDCKNCGSDRIATVSGKCNNLCNVYLLGQDTDGYVPRDMGIGGGDYLKFDYCLNCGCIQGAFPLPECELEQEEGEY